jgi:hypothetical protein
MLNERYRLQGFSSPSKLNLLAKSFGLRGVDLGRFVRASGIFVSDLQTWRAQALRGLDENRAMGKSERDYYRDRIQRLEKKLKEANALIELQKKAHNLTQSVEKNSPKNCESSSKTSSKKLSVKGAAKKSPAKP